MDFFAVINQRYSCRSFLADEVEEEKILKALEASRLAPSWQNRQPWRFIIVRDKEKIKRIAAFRPLRLNINIFLKEAPVIVLLCGNPKDSGTRAGLSYFLVDCAIAMEHFVLAATAQGLGTCWIGAFDEEYIKEILNIPKGVRVIALTPLGYPKEKRTLFDQAVKTLAHIRKRKALEDIVYFDKWGNKAKSPLRVD